MRRALLLALLPLAAVGGRRLHADRRRRAHPPEFDGSNSRVVDVVPYLRYYGKTLFVRTTQGILEGGARMNIGQEFYAGAQLAYEAGPRDGDPSASLGASLEKDLKLGPVPFFFLGRVRKHVDTDHGTQADFRVTMGIYGEDRVQAGIYGQATWASSQFTQAYYGIDEPGLLYTALGFLGSLRPQQVLEPGGRHRRALAIERHAAQPLRRAAHRLLRQRAGCGYRLLEGADPGVLLPSPRGAAGVVVPVELSRLLGPGHLVRAVASTAGSSTGRTCRTSAPCRR